MRVANAKHTMVGVNFQLPPQPAAPQPTAPVGPAAVANANRTMVGVSVGSPLGAVSAAPVAAAVVPAAPMANPSMVPGPASPAAYGAVAPNHDPNAKSGPKSPLAQAMVMPAAALAEAMAPPPTERVSGGGSSNSNEEFDVPGMGKQRKKNKSAAGQKAGSGASILLAVVVISVLVGGGVLIGLALRKHPASTLQAQFERSADGTRMLAIRVPQATVGAKIRYQQQEYAITNGVAQLPGTVVGDRVGEIVLPVQIVSNGESTASTATVVIAYLVRPILDGLAENPPVARLQIRVQPGARLMLDGQPVTTDASGVGLAAINDVRPLLATDAPLRHNFAIRVQNSNGSVAEGQYAFELTRTALSIERPVDHFATSSARAMVKVRAPGATSVFFNDQPATTHEGDVFSSAVAIGATGTTTVNVRALRAQFAPALAAVAIERVTDNAEGIARFAATDSSPCAPIAAATRVRFSGRVLGEPRPRDGGSTFQLLVQDRRCAAATPIWIDSEPDVTVRSGSTVQVFGTSTGTRTSVSTTGERRTDPVILAGIIQGGR